MNQALKPAWVIFGVLVVVTAVSLLVKASRPDEIIPWRPTYAGALEEARGSGKRTFVYFTAGWCVPCQKMKYTTWADKDVDAALRQFVPVKVDIDEHPELARQFGLDGVPTLIVLDGAGNPAKRVTGALPPPEFVEWLKS
jgi:thiol:disulfide interchange protein